MIQFGRPDIQVGYDGWQRRHYHCLVHCRKKDADTGHGQSGQGNEQPKKSRALARKSIRKMSVRPTGIRAENIENASPNLVY